MLSDQEGVNRGSKTPEQIRRERLDAEIGQWFEDGDPKHGRYSEFRRALDAISLAALKHAETTNAPLLGGDGSFEDLLERGLSVVQNLRWAVQPSDETEEEKKKLKLWSHRSQPLNDVRIKNMPHFGRSEIESTVGEYLALPYRADQIDRLLADLLIALELYQYADEMINELVFLEIGPPRSPLKQTHPFIYYMKSMSRSFLFWAVIGTAVFAFHHFDIIGDGWATFGYLTCAAFFLLGLTITTAILPLAWRKHTNQVAKVKSLMMEMSNCYSELRSDGPVSARHLLEQLKTAANKGVSWPAPLYALLDDAMARTGRL